MELMEPHPGELKLRRLRAGELEDAESQQLQGHLAGCGRCRVRLRSLELEQEQFEREISFDRFAAGVQRAVKSAEPRRVRWALPAMGMVAAVLVAIVTAPLVMRARGASSRRKGGSEVVLRIAGKDASIQRVASEQGAEPLSLGERIRIGYQAGRHSYLVAIAVDNAGSLTPLYEDKGRSLKVDPGDETRYLPDSLEFTGPGLERVIVILSDEPLELAKVKQAAEIAYRAVEGDLRRLPKLDVPGEQFQRLVLKP